MSWYKKLIKPAIAALAIGSAGLGHAQELEKDELKFGFIKLTDMAPLAIAYEKLFFEFFCFIFLRFERKEARATTRVTDSGSGFAILAWRYYEEPLQPELFREKHVISYCLFCKQTKSLLTRFSCCTPMFLS